MARFARRRSVWIPLWFVVFTVSLFAVWSGEPGFAGQTITRRGEVATIVGTPGPDDLRGTKRVDVIAGRGGNDRIRGRKRDDLLCGGPGGDQISGGPGNDGYTFLGPPPARRAVIQTAGGSRKTTWQPAARP